MASEPTEGFIDVRYVIGSPEESYAPNPIFRVERMGYLLPEGTTAENLHALTDSFWEDPHEVVEDIVEAFKGIPTQITQGRIVYGTLTTKLGPGSITLGATDE